MFWIRINHRSTPSPIRPLVTRRTCGADGSDDPPRHLTHPRPSSPFHSLSIGGFGVHQPKRMDGGRGASSLREDSPFGWVRQPVSCVCVVPLPRCLLLGLDCWIPWHLVSPGRCHESPPIGLPFPRWHRLSQGRPCLRRWNQHVTRRDVLPPPSSAGWVWQRPGQVGGQDRVEREGNIPPNQKKQKKRRKKERWTHFQRGTRRTHRDTSATNKRTWELEAIATPSWIAGEDEGTSAGTRGIEDPRPRREETDRIHHPTQPLSTNHCGKKKRERERRRNLCATHESDPRCLLASRWINEETHARKKRRKTTDLLFVALLVLPRGA